VRTCRGCGHENPADARFCNACGAALEAAAGPRQQRKTVTVIFCDVTGSTALGELLDPESFRQVMRRYFAAARHVIESHGGMVEKFIGDAVMAVFGVPVLHEDDALRAVRAAADLRKQIAALNQTLEADFGTTLSIRTGVNTGEVVTGTDERLATGDAVNLAARLEQAAAPGEIVLGPQTWRLVRDVATAESLGPLELKGKSLPVTAYRLLQVGDGPLRPAHSPTPFVGRGGQLRMLSDAFANVVGERSCSLCTVLGVAGVGKSRLTAEFLRDIGARVVTGRCLSYGQGITYSPAVEMVRQLVGTDAAAAAAAGLMAGDARVQAAIEVLLGEQQSVTSPAEIAWAVRKLLESAADMTPLVAVFDDLHWAEPALLDLIEHVADFSRGAPLLVLCLARPELLDHRPGWAGGKLNATTLLLEPLKPAETAELIGALVPAAGGLDPMLRDRVQVTAAGNPLFVEEMLALIRETGSRSLVVPPTIHALLAARLDQLGAEERIVLECGSVEGQSFHRGTVQVMASAGDDVSGHLMTLIRKDLLRPDEPVFAGDDAFRFRHLLIRDAAYEALAKADRAELHERFARWLEQRGTGPADLGEIAGYHLEQAFRYRCELGPADSAARRLAADAAGHLEAAGRRALDRSDTEAAVNLLERADAMAPPQINLLLQESLICALEEAGRLSEATSRAARIAGDRAAAGDRAGELRMRLLGAVLRLASDSQPEELPALIARARPVIERDGDAAASAWLDNAAGYYHFNRCRLADAFTAFSRATEDARQAGALWLEARMRLMAARCIEWGPTPIPEALAWLDDAQAQSPAHQSQLEVWRAAMLAQLGRFDAARSLLAHAVAQMTERGQELVVAISLRVEWEIEMLAGDAVAAERAARHGCDELERLGERALLSTRACDLADALYALGRYPESGQWARRGLDLGSGDDLATQVAGRGMQARLLARRGDASAALAMAGEADAIALTTDSLLAQGNAALDLAEVRYLTGDAVRGREEILRAVEQYERKGAAANAARARRLAAQWEQAATAP
jgi:predicted ATPase/class 3 adenylate cyclase